MQQYMWYFYLTNVGLGEDTEQSSTKLWVLKWSSFRFSKVIIYIYLHIRVESSQLCGSHWVGKGIWQVWAVAINYGNFHHTRILRFFFDALFLFFLSELWGQKIQLLKNLRRFHNPGFCSALVRRTVRLVWFCCFICTLLTCLRALSELLHLLISVLENLD